MAPSTTTRAKADDGRRRWNWIRSRDIALVGVIVLVGTALLPSTLDYDSFAAESAGRRLLSEEADPDDPPARGAATCSEDGIPGLVAALRSNIDRNGLRPLSAESSSGLEIFPGLDAGLIDAAFRGRRILLYGDSTERNLNLWLNLLLAPDHLPVEGRPALFDSLAGMGVDEATLRLRMLTRDRCSWRANQYFACGVDKNERPLTALSDGTRVEYIDARFCGRYVPRDVNLIFRARPHVVVANMGLWLLHFQARGRSRDPCTVETWVRYEDWFLERLVSAAERAGTEALVFKTTNFICDEKYTDGYADAAALYAGRDADALRDCFDDIRGRTSDAALSDADVANYCDNGQFDSIGAAYLNLRLARFVERRRRTAAVEILLMNDHGIQSCDSTAASDARHHHRIQLARVRLLGNLLTCERTPPTRADDDAPGRVSEEDGGTIAVEEARA